MPWRDITTTEQYQSLPPEQQIEQKRAYFRERVLPSIRTEPRLNVLTDDVLERVWLERPDDSGQDYFTSMLSSAGRGAASIVPGAVGGLGYLTGSETLQQAGEDIESGIEEFLPVNPAYEQDFAMKAAGAVGQAVGFFGTGGVGGLAGKALGGARAAGKLLSAAEEASILAKAASNVGRALSAAEKSQVLKGAAVAKATKLGAETVGLGSGILGGVREGGQTAEQYGLEGTAGYLSALGRGAIEGASEKLLFGLGTETAAVRKLLGDTLEKGAGGFAKDTLTEGAEEVFAQGAGNLLTSGLLGATGSEIEGPGLTEGMGEAFALGAVGGATFGTINALTGAYQRNALPDEIDAEQVGNDAFPEAQELINQAVPTIAETASPVAAGAVLAEVNAAATVESGIGETFTYPDDEQDESGPEFISRPGLERAAQQRLDDLRRKRDGVAPSFGETMPDGTPLPATRGVAPQYLSKEERDEIAFLEAQLEGGAEFDHTAVAQAYGKKLKTTKTGGRSTQSLAPTAEVPIAEESVPVAEVQPTDDWRGLFGRAGWVATQNKDDAAIAQVNRLAERHRDIRRELDDAVERGAGEGEIRALKYDLVEIENAARKIAGEQEVSVGTTVVTPEDQAKADAWFAERALGIEQKVARGEEITERDREEWAVAGRDPSVLPAPSEAQTTPPAAPEAPVTPQPPAPAGQQFPTAQAPSQPTTADIARTAAEVATGARPPEVSEAAKKVMPQQEPPAPISLTPSEAEAKGEGMTSETATDFQPDEKVVMRSPHTGEDTEVSYRGPLGTDKSVVWTGKTQMSVPTSWLRKLGGSATSETISEGEAGLSRESEISQIPPAETQEPSVRAETPRQQTLPLPTTKAGLIEEIAGKEPSDYDGKQRHKKLVRSLRSQTKAELTDRVLAIRESAAKFAKQQEITQSNFEAVRSRLDAAGPKWRAEAANIAKEAGIEGYTTMSENSKGEEVYRLSQRLAERGVSLTPKTQTPQPNAVQEPSSTEGVLRQEGPELELPRVAEQDTEEAAQGASAETEVATEPSPAPQAEPTTQTATLGEPTSRDVGVAPEQGTVNRSANDKQSDVTVQSEVYGPRVATVEANAVDAWLRNNGVGEDQIKPKAGERGYGLVQVGRVKEERKAPQFSWHRSKRDDRDLRLVYKLSDGRLVTWRYEDNGVYEVSQKDVTLNRPETTATQPVETMSPSQYWATEVEAMGQNADEADAREMHAGEIIAALRPRKPVSAEAVDTYNIPLPEGYVRQGDLYVYQPDAPTTQAPTTEPAVPAEQAPEAAETAVADTYEGDATAVLGQKEAQRQYDAGKKWAADNLLQDAPKEYSQKFFEDKASLIAKKRPKRTQYSSSKKTHRDAAFWDGASRALSNWVKESSLESKRGRIREGKSVYTDDLDAEGRATLTPELEAAGYTFDTDKGLWKKTEAAETAVKTGDITYDGSDYSVPVSKGDIVEDQNGKRYIVDRLIGSIIRVNDISESGAPRSGPLFRVDKSSPEYRALRSTGLNYFDVMREADSVGAEYGRIDNQLPGLLGKLADWEEALKFDKDGKPVAVKGRNKNETDPEYNRLLDEAVALNSEYKNSIAERDKMRRGTKKRENADKEVAALGEKFSTAMDDLNKVAVSLYNKAKSAVDANKKAASDADARRKEARKKAVAQILGTDKPLSPTPAVPAEQAPEAAPAPQYTEAELRRKVEEARAAGMDKETAQNELDEYLRAGNAPEAQNAALAFLRNLKKNNPKVYGGLAVAVNLPSSASVTELFDAHWDAFTTRSTDPVTADPQPKAKNVRPKPKSRNRYAAYGSILRTKVSTKDAQRAVELETDTPGLDGTMFGTLAELRDQASNNPGLLSALDTAEREDAEAFFWPDKDGNPVAVVIVDQMAVYSLDAALARQNGTTPAVEAVRRVLRHENVGHRGWGGLPQHLRDQWLAAADELMSPEDADDLVSKGYREFADWRTNDASKAGLFEEWVARQTENPVIFANALKRANKGTLRDLLRDLWNWLTGGNAELLDPSDEQLVQLVADLLTYAGRAPAGRVMKASYAGRRAIENLPEERRQFMRDSLATAEAMAAAGKSSEEIRAVTGWFPGKYDGKMRWEIPDEGATANPPGIERLRKGEEVPLQDVLRHQKLFAAYPSLRDVGVLMSSNNAYNERSDTILLRRGSGLGTLLHEIQHAIQRRESWPRGGTPSVEAWLNPEMREALLKVSQDTFKKMQIPAPYDTWLGGAEGTPELRKEYDNYVKDLKTPARLDRMWVMAQEGAASNLYPRLAGEIEARDVQARLSYTPEQRKAVAPYSSENIAPEDAIVLFGSRVAESRRALGTSLRDLMPQETVPQTSIPDAYARAREGSSTAFISLADILDQMSPGYPMAQFEQDIQRMVSDGTAILEPVNEVVEGMVTVRDPNTGQPGGWLYVPEQMRMSRRMPDDRVGPLTAADEADDKAAARAALPKEITVVAIEDEDDLDEDGNPMPYYIIGLGSPEEVEQWVRDDAPRDLWAIGESDEQFTQALAHDTLYEVTLSSLLPRKEIAAIPVRQHTVRITRGMKMSRRMPDEADARFDELTADLPDTLTQEDIDEWKAENPEKWTELSAMREEALKAAAEAPLLDAESTQSTAIALFKDAQNDIDYYTKRLNTELTQKAESEAQNQAERESKNWVEAGFSLDYTPAEFLRALDLGLTPPKTREDVAKQFEVERQSAKREIENARKRQAFHDKGEGSRQTPFKTGQAFVAKVFHTSPFGKIQSFDPDLLGTATGAPSATLAHFFAGDRATSETYGIDESFYVRLKGFHRLTPKQQKVMLESMRAQKPLDEWTPEEVADEAYALFDALPTFDTSPIENVVHEVFIKMDNPLVVDQGGGYRESSYFDALQKAAADGHDGVVWANSSDPGPSAPFEMSWPANIFAILRGGENQIKSADPLSPGPKIPPSQWGLSSSDDIRFSRPDRSQRPTFLPEDIADKLSERAARYHEADPVTGKSRRKPKTPWASNLPIDPATGFPSRIEMERTKVDTIMNVAIDIVKDLGPPGENWWNFINNPIERRAIGITDDMMYPIYTEMENQLDPTDRSLDPLRFELERFQDTGPGGSSPAGTQLAIVKHIQTHPRYARLFAEKGMRSVKDNQIQGIVGRHINVPSAVQRVREADDAAQGEATDNVADEVALEWQLLEAGIDLQDPALREEILALNNDLIDRAYIEELLADKNLKASLSGRTPDQFAARRAALAKMSRAKLEAMKSELDESIAKRMENISKMRTKAAPKRKGSKAKTVQEQAEDLLDRASKQQAKRKPAPNPVRDAYRDQLKRPTSREEFVKTLAGIGVDADTAGKLYDVAAAKRVALEMAAAKNSAGAILNRLAVTHSDTQAWRKKAAANPVTELYNEHLKSKLPKPDFVGRMEKLGVDRTTAENIWSMGNTEREARRKVKDAKRPNKADEEKLNTAQKTARDILNRLAVSQSDTQAWPKKSAPNPMRDLYNRHMKTPVSLEEFVKEATDLGVAESEATNLWNVANRERRNRETVNKLTREDARRRSLLDLTPKAAPDRAASKPSTIRGLLSKAKSELLGRMNWDTLFNHPLNTQREWRQELFNKVRADEAFANLTDQEARDLAAELDRLWNEQRQKAVERDLKKLTPSGNEEVRNRVAKATPALLRAINRGTFNESTFRTAIAPKFGIGVLSDAEMQKVSELAAKAQDMSLTRPERKQAGIDMMELLQKNTDLTKAEVLSNWWVTSVLSGPRTLFDMAFNFLNGARIVSQFAVAAAATKKGGVKSAFRGFQDYMKGLYDGIQEAIAYIISGDDALLDSTERRLNAYFGEGSRAVPVDAWGKVMRDPKSSWWKNPYTYFLGTVQRAMVAFDHITAVSTAEGLKSLAVTLNPSVYGDAQLPDADDIAAAKETAKRVVAARLPEGANLDSFVNKRQVNAATRQILNDVYAKRFPRLLDDVQDIGMVASFQNDPTGLGGFIYHGLLNMNNRLASSAGKFKEKGAERRQSAQEKYYRDMEAKGVKNPPPYRASAEQWLREAVGTFMFFEAVNSRNQTGLRFVRFVGNKLNEMLSFLPGMGYLRWFEDVMDENPLQKQLLHTNQIVGGMTSAALAVALWKLAFDSDDEDEESPRFMINGPWNYVKNWEQKNRLRDVGSSPNSIEIRDKDGNLTVFNYTNWPLSGLLAAVGNLIDMKRFDRETWESYDTFKLLGAGLMSTGGAVFDMNALSAFTSIFLNRDTFGRDPVGGLGDRLAKWAANYAGGFIPRMAKDIDLWQEPTYNRPEDLKDLFWKEVPFFRRTKVEGEKALNMFGEPVRVERAPWSRAVVRREVEEHHKVARQLIDKGIFFSAPNPDVRTVQVPMSNERRPMDDNEAEVYVTEAGRLYKNFFTSEGERVLAMPRDVAKKYIDERLRVMRNQAFIKATMR